MPDDQELSIIRTQVVPEAGARFLSFRIVPVPRTKELTRYWTVTNDTLMGPAIEFLEEWGSTANPSKRFYVENPVALGPRGKAYSGIWRCASVGRDKQGRIVQVLRKGWATSLSEDEARISQTSGTPATGDYKITLYWPNIAHTSIESLVRTLNATKTVTAPNVEGVPLAGLSFAVSGVGGTRSEDGSGVVTKTLTQIQSPADWTALQALAYRASYEKEILSLFGLQEGVGEGMALVWTNLADTAAMQTLCEVTILDTDLKTLADTIPSTSYGWSVAGRKFLPAEDGTRQFVAGFRKVTWNKRWASDRLRLGLSKQGGKDQSIRVAAEGLTKTGSAAEFGAMTADASSAWVAATAYTPGDISSTGTPTVDYICLIPHTSGVFATDLAAGKWIAASYVLHSKQRAYQGDGKYALEGEMAPIFSGTAASDAAVREVQAPVGRREAMVTREWYRRSATALATLTAPGGAAQQGFIHPSGVSGTNWTTLSGTIAVGTVANDDGGGTGVWVCITAHTKGASFAADYLLGYWRLYVGNYQHVTHVVTDHRDGAYTVTQIAVIPSFSLDVTYTGERLVRRYKDEFRMTDTPALTVKTVEVYRRVFTLKSDAESYADDSTTYFTASGNETDGGRVDYDEASGKWMAYKTVLS